MKDKNIPVNKGNYTLETAEREHLFDKYRAQGWESGYKEYRKNWNEFPKKNYISEYPLLVDFELSTACNLKCPMCYTITDEFKKNIKTQFMDFNLFKKVINEIAEKVPAIRLSLRGEPTLHKNFIECIKYAKEKGIKEVSSLTNASNLTPQYFEKIMLAGIDWLTISIDGLGETYESIRMPLKFEDTLEKIKNIKLIKEKNNRQKPVIKIQSIWPAIKNDPSSFYNTFEPYVDFIAFNPLIDYLGNDDEILYEQEFCCPQIFQRLVITSDGQVSPCANDEKSQYIIGSAYQNTVNELWHGDKLNKLREIHIRNEGCKCIEICKNCYMPRLTEENETAEVNGRKFVVKNYINRKQVIGE